MMEITPRLGVGPVQFGFSPREVKAIWGEQQTWEAWMGGNLNDSLFYSGIVVGFDHCDASGPLEGSHVVEFTLHKTLGQFQFMGLDVFSIHRGDLERRLSEVKISFESHDDSVLLPEYSLEFLIGSDDIVCEVNFWKQTRTE